MILSFIFGGFTLWVLTVALVAVWYGVLICIGVIAASIAAVLVFIVWVMNLAGKAIESAQGRFG